MAPTDAGRADSSKAGQKRTWQQMMSGASTSSRPDFTDAALQSAYEAPGRPSQLRQHPLQRAADAAAVLTTQRQQQLAAPAVAGPAHNDLADPLTGLQQQPRRRPLGRQLMDVWRYGDYPRL